MPENVAIAPASSVATSATTASSETGSSVRTNAPPETGGISATTSPSASSVIGRRVLLVDRVEQALGLVAEVERGPHVGDARRLDLPLRPARPLAQAGEQPHRHPHAK